MDSQRSFRFSLASDSELDHLLELLFGADQVRLVEVALADEEEGVVDPLRIGVVAQHVRTFADGRLQILAGPTGIVGGEDPDVAEPLHPGLRSCRSRFPLHAPAVRLPRVVEGVVVRLEVVDGPPQEPGSAAALEYECSQEHRDGDRESPGDRAWMPFGHVQAGRAGFEKWGRSEIPIRLSCSNAIAG